MPEQVFSANSGTVTLYKGVPLSSDYYDTYYVENDLHHYTRQLQDNFFSQARFQPRVFNNISYQRVNSSVGMPRKPLTLRVPELADNLYQYNYLKFTPSNWTVPTSLSVDGELNTFYAFINQVNYINPNNTEIVYQIDEFQTWFPYCTIKPSYIVREHSETDFIGENLTAEQVPLGDIIYNPFIGTPSNPFYPIIPYCNNTFNDLQLSNLYVVVWSLYGVQAARAEKSPPSIINGNIQAVGAYVYDPRYIIPAEDLNPPRSDLIKLYEDLNAIADEGKSDGIIAIEMLPLENMQTKYSASELHSGINIIGGLSVVTPPKTSLPLKQYEYDMSNLKNLNSLNGYTPRNNKLLTFPYSYMIMTNHRGVKQDLCYEFFDNREPKFTIEPQISPNSSAICFPKNYLGQHRNALYTIEIPDFPHGSWAIDNYANWYALNRGSIAAQRLVNVTALGAAVGITTSNVPVPISNPHNLPVSPNDLRWVLDADKTRPVTTFGVAISKMAVANAIGYELSLLDKKRMPNSLGGTLEGYLAYSANLNNIGIYPVCIRAEFAQKIDEYFDAFGYALGNCKKPNLVSRRNWNYIKMLAPTIEGSIPAQSLDTIVKMFENGIRLWHKNGIGDYGDRTNPIV